MQENRTHPNASIREDPSSAPAPDEETNHQWQSNKGLGINRVEQFLNKAQDRLVTIAADAPLTKAAELLFMPASRMAIVCDPEGSMIGVVTRTDIVRQIRHCQGCSCTTACRDVMTSEVIYYRVEDNLDDIWSIMTSRGLHNVPIVDRNRKPIGLLSARDILEARLASVAYEEDLLRDYVMSVGYH